MGRVSCSHLLERHDAEPYDLRLSVSVRRARFTANADVVLRAIDRQGHMGVEGQVGVRTYDAEVKLHFSTFTFDPSQLVRFAAEARELAAAVASPTQR